MSNSDTALRDQLFEIIHNRKRMPGEQFSDVEGKIESLIATEVERRIAERLPSEEMLNIEINHLTQRCLQKEGLYAYTQREVELGQRAWKMCYDWLRSRLTENKQEGGGNADKA